MKIYFIFVLILIFVANCESGKSTKPNCDFESTWLRAEGGYSNITQQQCEELGSCYDDTITGVRWCFRENKGRSRNPSCNFENPNQRINGGWPGITKLQCESLGYCFDDTIDNVMYCFKQQAKVSSSNCDFRNPEYRVDGGFAGITRQECVTTGNCFDDSITDSKWCFKYNRGRTLDFNCDYRFPITRVNGGYDGITKDECEAFGNCFDDTIDDFFWCFLPNREYDV